MLFVAILEVVMVSWIYGVDKIFEHIEEMEIKIPTFMKCYWRVCWKYLTPGNTIQVQKPVNLKYITVGQLDDDMIVLPSDGPMFILINWE